MLKVKNYKASDYSELAANLKEADLFDEVWDSEENVKGTVKNYPESVIVAEENGKVVGSAFLVNQDPKLMYFFRLVVSNEYHSKGIATKLIEKATEIAKKNGVKELGMYVDSSKEKTP